MKICVREHHITEKDSQMATPYTLLRWMEVGLNGVRLRKSSVPSATKAGPPVNRPHYSQQGWVAGGVRACQCLLLLVLQ
jgi:hypothetical protein